MPSLSVIVNTSPLLYLFRAGQIEILRGLYEEVLAPPAVADELLAGSRVGVVVPRLAEYPWIRAAEVRGSAVLPAIVDLGRGEAEVIALGLERAGSLLILDDMLARRVAALNGLRVTGTLGVLLRAKQRGILSEVRPTLDRLREGGMWLSDDVCAWLLRQAGE